jgi:hypothetical protein
VVHVLHAETPAHPRKPIRTLDLDGACSAMRELRQAVGGGKSGAGLFGQERGDQLGAILGAVEQAFGGEPLQVGLPDRTCSDRRSPDNRSG